MSTRENLFLLGGQYTNEQSVRGNLCPFLTDQEVNWRKSYDLNFVQDSKIQTSRQAQSGNSPLVHDRLCFFLNPRAHSIHSKNPATICALFMADPSIQNPIHPPYSCLKSNIECGACLENIGGEKAFARRVPYSTGNLTTYHTICVLPRLIHEQSARFFEINHYFLVAFLCNGDFFSKCNPPLSIPGLGPA